MPAVCFLLDLILQIPVAARRLPLRWTLPLRSRSCTASVCAQARTPKPALSFCGPARIAARLPKNIHPPSAVAPLCPVPSFDPPYPQVLFQAAQTSARQLLAALDYERSLLPPHLPPACRPAPQSWLAPGIRDWPPAPFARGAVTTRTPPRPECLPPPCLPASTRGSSRWNHRAAHQR